MEENKSYLSTLYDMQSRYNKYCNLSLLQYLLTITHNPYYNVDYLDKYPIIHKPCPVIMHSKPVIISYKNKHIANSNIPSYILPIITRQLLHILK